MWVTNLQSSNHWNMEYALEALQLVEVWTVEDFLWPFAHVHPSLRFAVVASLDWTYAKTRNRSNQATKTQHCVLRAPNATTFCLFRSMSHNKAVDGPTWKKVSTFVRAHSGPACSSHVHLNLLANSFWHYNVSLMLHVSPCITSSSQNKCKLRMTYHNLTTYNMTFANVCNTMSIYRYWYKHPKIFVKQTLPCRRAVPYTGLCSGRGQRGTDAQSLSLCADDQAWGIFQTFYKHPPSPPSHLLW